MMGGMKILEKYFMMSAEHAGEADKNGMFGIFTKSMRVLKPNEVCTHSYFLIGKYETEKEAENTLLYLKTKFVRFIVMTTLSAVNLSKLVFENVPIQDFTINSDIDWDKSITEIDQQLYTKYGFPNDEIDFIEGKIKPIA